MNAEDFILDPNKKRYIHLDMLRVLAVMLVAVDHGASREIDEFNSKEWSINNVLFTQSWVLQLLWVTAGISFSLSKARIVSYQLRLLVYFSIGVSCNLAAWVVAGLDWRHDPEGVIYQLFFIVGLIVYSLLTACLKPSLLRIKASRLEAASDNGEVGKVGGLAPRTEMPGTEMRGVSREALMHSSDYLNPFTPDLEAASSTWPTDAAPWGNRRIELDDEEYRAAARFGGLVVVQLLTMVVSAIVLTQVKTAMMRTLFNFILGTSVQFWTQGLDDREFFGQLLGTLGVFFLVVAGSKLLRSPRLAPWLAWVVMAYIYINRIVLLPTLFTQYGGGVARFFVGFELFLVGLVASTAGLKHAGTLKRWIGHYWLAVLFANGVLWGPTWHTRMDEHPPQDISIIFRVQACEAIWVISFLAAGSLMFTEEAWPSHIRTWLCDYATLLFLVHKAIHIAVPIPLNWILLFIVLPLVFWWRGHTTQVRGTLEKEPCDCQRPSACVELPMSGVAASHGMVR